MDDNQALDDFAQRRAPSVVSRTCIYCGSAFTMPFSRRNRIAICSSACREEIRRIRAREALEVLKFDESDRPLLEKYIWSVDRKTGYARAKVGKKNVSIHRLLMGLDHGDPRYVDHINGDKLDNRRGNLRICTSSQNSANMKIDRANTSGFKGVSWHAAAGKWAAKIAQKYLGLFESAQEAHEAYKRAADEIYGEFANYG